MAGNGFTSCQVSLTHPTARAGAEGKTSPSSTPLEDRGPRSAAPLGTATQRTGSAWCPLRMRLVGRVWCLQPLPWAWGSAGWGSPPGLGMSTGTSSNGATEKRCWGRGEAVSGPGSSSARPGSGFLGAKGEGCLRIGVFGTGLFL